MKFFSKTTKNSNIKVLEYACNTRILASIPSSSMSNVITALSVWISHNMSPGEMGSPTERRQGFYMQADVQIFYNIK